MARRARRKSATNVYHVVIKGVDGLEMFVEGYDYVKYLELLNKYCKECNFTLYAFCLMSNHVHLLINTNGSDLGKIFSHLNTKYSMWYNKKYQRSGHFQQNRYKSEPVEDLGYLFNVVRYIHKNPKNAGLENRIGESYPWSSYHDYQKRESILVDTDFLLSLFGTGKRFFEFHDEEDEEDCYLEVRKKKILITDEKAIEIMQVVSGCLTSAEFLQLSTEDKVECIKMMHENRVSIRQLNRVTGVPKGVIEGYLRRG